MHLKLVSGTFKHLSQSTSSLLVGLTEADPWPMDGYSEIIKLGAGKMLTRYST